jgi:hypothetical protein
MAGSNRRIASLQSYPMNGIERFRSNGTRNKCEAAISEVHCWNHQATVWGPSNSSLTTVSPDRGASQ